jgi:hypothetical protein
MRNWTERTGVYDDICYLRQAHLFQRFGLGGFDTDISRDDDRYFATLAREVGYAAWADQTRAPCHTPIGAKHVIQYPLGSNLAFDLWMLDVSVAVFSADILTEGPTTATER